MQWQNPNGSTTNGVVIEDGAGNKLGTSANPLNVTGVSGGGGGGSNASVAATGVAAPSSATAIGFQNAGGSLTLPTPSAGLPVAQSGSWAFSPPATQLDGANGASLSAAAGYLCNSGGPLASGGAASGLAYDRARSLSGKGLFSTTLNGATTVGATSIVVAAANGLAVGAPVRVGRQSGSEETAYVASTYTTGSLTVPLQSALALAHASGVNVEWDVFASSGVANSGVTPYGVSVGASLIYSHTSGAYYIPRAADADGYSGSNVQLIAGGVYNGATYDRPRSASAAQATTGIGVPASAAFGVYNSSGIALANGQFSAIQMDATGSLRIALANAIGVTATSFINQFAAVIAPATPAATAIKAGSGRLYLLEIGNCGATDVWVKLFNVAVGSVTLGATVATTNLYVPKGTRQVYSMDAIGDYFSAAITFAVTGGILLTDNTAITANTVTVSARYI